MDQSFLPPTLRTAAPTGGMGGQDDYGNLIMNMIQANPQNPGLQETLTLQYLDYMNPMNRPQSGGLMNQLLAGYLGGGSYGALAEPAWLTETEQEQGTPVDDATYDAFKQWQNQKAGIYPSGTVPTQQPWGEKAVGTMMKLPTPFRALGGIQSLRTGGWQGLQDYLGDTSLF